MSDLLGRAGYDLDTRTSVGATMLDLIPRLNQFPVIGDLVKRVEDVAKRMWKMLPKMILDGLTLMMMKMSLAKVRVPMMATVTSMIRGATCSNFWIFCVAYCFIASVIAT